MKRRTLIAAAVFFGFSASGYSDAISDYAVGRKDGNLKATLAAHFSPPSLLPTEEQLYDAMLSIYSVDDMYVKDVLTDEVILPYHDSFSDNNNVMIARIMDSSWMVFPENDASHDLYNLVITDLTISSTRGGLPFYEVDDIVSTSGEMLRGYSVTGTEMIECLEPSHKHKGDIARMIFYVVTVYPMDLWGGWGAVVCRNNPYPTLSECFADVYMKWHREDPVDDTELARCNAIAVIQGNINPFVGYPDLAEYLWGDKKGTTYGTGGGASDDNQEVKIPLRGEYLMSDGYLDLYSPYVPDNVRWFIEEKECAGRIMLSSLGVGQHAVTYENENVRGKLKINIKP